MHSITQKEYALVHVLVIIKYHASGDKDPSGLHAPAQHASIELNGLMERGFDLVRDTLRNS